MHKPLTVAAIALLSFSFSLATPAAATINANNIPGLDAKVLKLAMNGYRWAAKQGKVTNHDVITIVDYTKPSYSKRMWVISLKSGKVLMNTRVTHGQNSGQIQAIDFSNTPESRKTSLGVYTTANTYYGKHGKSMRLHGLQRGVNDNAWRRAIVFHPAKYASEDYFQRKGKLGRSWGCLAVDPKVANQFINYTKGGSVIFAYAKPIEATAAVKNKIEISENNAFVVND